MTSGPSPQRTPGLRRAIFWSVVNTVLGGSVLLAATLKENPAFWRNVGGYPIGLRDLIYVLFYPALLAYFIGIAGLAWSAFRLMAGGRKSGTVIFCASLVQGVLLVAILIITVWNNVDNLFNGRPLHWHPAD